MFHYCNCKLTCDVARYVTIVDRDKFSRCLANVRGSSHELMIKQGRHYGLPEEYRTCPYWEGCIEDQIHFLLICPLYKELRSRYLSIINEIISHIYMFYRLMSSNYILCVRNIAMYI